MRRHAVGATVAGFSLVAAAAGLVWLGVWHERRQQGLLARSGRLRQALSRAMDRPERVASQPTIPERIVGGILTAAAAAVVKKLLERGLRAALDSRRVTAGAATPAALPAAPSVVRWPERASEVATTRSIGPPVSERVS